jgi:hypothetical protein
VLLQQAPVALDRLDCETAPRVEVVFDDLTRGKDDALALLAVLVFEPPLALRHPRRLIDLDQLVVELGDVGEFGVDQVRPFECGVELLRYDAGPAAVANDCVLAVHALEALGLHALDILRAGAHRALDGLLFVRDERLGQHLPPISLHCRLERRAPKVVVNAL